MTRGMKYFKREIRELRQSIDGWHLKNCPLSDSLSDHNRFVKWVLSKHRTQIACAGIIEMRHIIVDRAQQNRKTAKHAQDHPKVWGSSTEKIVERFTKLAAECDKSIKKADVLLAKVNEAGLPDELKDYLPWQ